MQYNAQHAPNRRLARLRHQLYPALALPNVAAVSEADLHQSVGLMKLAADGREFEIH